MIKIIKQKDYREVRKLPFCYICGKQFSGDNAQADRDHVPPESVFHKKHREPLTGP